MTDNNKTVKVSYKEYPSGLYGHGFTNLNGKAIEELGLED